MQAQTTLDRSELPPPTAAPPANAWALGLVDEALAGYAGRSLISGTDVIDRLLDLRNALAAEWVLQGLEALEPASS